MKISWGSAIAIFYVAFMVIILAIVIYAAGFELNLETEDYYADEQVYQEVIDKKINVNDLETKPVIIKDGLKITIQFPEMREVKGTLVLFRASDNRLDKSFDIVLDESNQQIIDITGLRKGKWKAKLDWEADGKNYYMERELRF